MKIEKLIHFAFLGSAVGILTMFFGCSNNSPLGLKNDNTNTPTMYTAPAKQADLYSDSRKGLARVASDHTLTMPGVATDISIGQGDNHMYKTGGGSPDGNGNFPMYFTRLDSTVNGGYPTYGWHQIPGAAVRIAKGAGSVNLCCIQANGNLFSWANNTWNYLLSNCRDAAISPYGRIYVLCGNADGYGNYPLYCSDNGGANWASISGLNVFRLAVAYDSRLWAVTKTGGVYNWAGSWTYVSGIAYGGVAGNPDIGVWNSAPNTWINVIATDGEIHQSFNNGATWDVLNSGYPIPNANSKGINITDGLQFPPNRSTGFWAVDLDGVVYAYRY
jgi:hypothetical protein